MQLETPTSKPTRGRRRRVLAAVLGGFAILAVLALVVGGAAYAWYEGVIGAASGPSTAVALAIPAGSGTEQIATLLEQRGIVSSALRFRLRSRAAGADGKLKAGEYRLATNMPDDLVIERLRKGPEPVYTTVTIPEGFTVEQIAARLEKKTGIPADDFLRLASGGAKRFAKDHPYLKGAYLGSLEGFLFPKTYRIAEGATAAEVIEMMLDQFDEEIAKVDAASAEKRGLTLPQLVIVASLVEREARIDKDRPLIASVIYNRLDKDMRLQLCSSVEYVLKKRILRLTVADTQVDSPYNTYRHDGLTPGPIANPGLESLKAAAEPAETSYVYYVLTGRDGSHTFATTPAQFAEAKRKSKEVFGR